MKEDKQKLYEEFLNILNHEDIKNIKVLSHLNKVKEKISNDLVNSKLKICLLYLLFSIVGYFIALSVCAQGSIGFTSFSYNNLYFLQSIFSPFISSMTCGAIYTTIPFLFSLLLLNRFKRRFIFFKMIWLIMIIPLISTTVIFLFYTYNKPLMTPYKYIDGAAIWVFSANITPYILYLLTYFVIRQKIIKKEINHN